MNDAFIQTARRVCGADEIFHLKDIQSLWSGYGKIVRYGLKGGNRDSVIVKHVKLPERADHPRGWDTDRSHRRKIKSYHVESAWYRDWNKQSDAHCRTAHCLALEEHEDEFLMVLEDLDAAGFALRRDTVSVADMQACLRWLANFHARFMGETPAGLWEVGTYWHLATRPDELAVLDDQALKAAAGEIDRLLRTARYQTFVHGDAKLANFCFSDTGEQVAAVDFQYVGGGCGMKDVAYFISSCLDEEACERHETELLDGYFTQLKTALQRRAVSVDPYAVEAQWRALYPVAWTDFYRFLKGWSPGHWKIHGYSERLAREVVAGLNVK